MIERPSDRQIPSSLATVRTLAGVTLLRLGRGKALWIGGGFAALQVVYASLVRSLQVEPSQSNPFLVALLLLAILPAMFVGGSIGQEIEDRTSTYLWSRPIARWAVPAGKLCALAPLVIVLLVAGWYAAGKVWGHTAPPLISCVALAAGCVATSLVAAAIAIIVPRHGMALTIGYMLVDLFVGALPFSLRALSITYQTGELANLDGASPGVAEPALAMAAIAAVWTVIGLVRIRRLES